jgi:hypothetical protein|tara:strand:+ start:378 stop:671 length:294 start_codon:yes stop_codon:yes gene_type:complete
MTIAMWPTPRASDVEGGIVKNVELENGFFSRKNKEGVRWGVKLRDAVNHAHNLSMSKTTQTGGRLNPKWVEWLMGYPTEWTDLKDSETQLSLKLHKE